MTETCSFTIDGQHITAAADASILNAAGANGIYIPHLCNHPDLKPTGACRLCFVSIDGGKPRMACREPVQDGISVVTSNPAIQQTRIQVMELLIADHHMDCLACAAAHDCGLLKISAYLGISPNQLSRLGKSDHNQPVDNSNPFFRFDPNKCVLCGICVRTCDEIVGLRALGYAHRGVKTSIGPAGNQLFTESICESCGECVQRCPVGALTPKEPEIPAREVRSTCVYCGVGCGIHIGVRGDTVVSIRGDRDRATNAGSLCVKGRFGFRYINHPDRLTQPLVRKNGELTASTWNEALDLIAEKFNKSRGHFAALASAKCTNEENYLIQKFTREVMGTNNIDHCARL